MHGSEEAMIMASPATQALTHYALPSLTNRVSIGDLVWFGVVWCGVVGEVKLNHFTSALAVCATWFGGFDW